MKTKLISTLALAATLVSFGFPAAARHLDHHCIYKLSNRVGRDIHFNLEGRQDILYPGQSQIFNFCHTGSHPNPNFKIVKHRIRRRPLLEYDSILGRGYRVRRVRLRPGQTIFDRRGKVIYHTHVGDGPNPNFTRNR